MKIQIADITQICEAILKSCVEDDYIVKSWTEIAINRDLIGDFARGTARLESIMERLEHGLITSRLELNVEQITSFSARVYSTYRNWPDEVGKKSAELAASLADIHGIGIVAFPKPNILGECLDPIIKANQIGIVFSQNAPLLNLGFSKENLIGNNPIALCAPGNPPFLFDGSFGAFSRHSFVSLKEFVDVNGYVPTGVVQDKHGEASQDADILGSIVNGERTNGSFQPLGRIKGLGMAMGLEFIAGALTGGFFGQAPGKPWGEGAIVFALSSKLFNSMNMLEHIETYINQFDTYPGKNSYLIRSEAMKQGWIEYPINVVESIRQVAKKIGVNVDLLRGAT